MLQHMRGKAGGTDREQSSKHAIWAHVNLGWIAMTNMGNTTIDNEVVHLQST